MKVAISSSTKKGFPSARSTTRLRISSGISAPSSWLRSRPVSAGARASRCIADARPRAPPQAGRRSRISGRAVASTSSGPATFATNVSIKSHS